MAGRGRGCPRSQSAHKRASQRNARREERKGDSFVARILCSRSQEDTPLTLRPDLLSPDRQEEPPQEPRWGHSWPSLLLLAGLAAPANTNTPTPSTWHVPFYLLLQPWQSKRTGGSQLARTSGAVASSWVCGSQIALKLFKPEQAQPRKLARAALFSENKITAIVRVTVEQLTPAQPPTVGPGALPVTSPGGAVKNLKPKGAPPRRR